jgi:hypothetical protein
MAEIREPRDKFMHLLQTTSCQKYQKWTLEDGLPLPQMVLGKLYIQTQKIETWPLSLTLYKTQFKTDQIYHMWSETIRKKTYGKHFKMLMQTMIF